MFDQNQNFNLYARIAQAFPIERNACAIEATGARYYTWDDLERGSAMIANVLRQSGLHQGDRVAVQVEKSVESLMLYLATIRAGYVYLPLNPGYREIEIEYFLGDAKPGVVVCRPKDFAWVSRMAFRHRAKHVYTLGDECTGSLLARAVYCQDHFPTVHCSADDVAAIIYTSGTTGRSKGAMLSHGNLASNAAVLKTFWGWRPDDVLLHALPLFHVHGLFVACHGALMSGSKMIFMDKFDAQKVLQCLPQATVYMGVPTHYVRLLAQPGLNRHVARHMRLFLSGSAPLLPDTFDQFATATGQFILERYGMSETLMLVSNPYEGPRIRGTVGVPLPGVEVRVVDARGHRCASGQVGAIEVKGSNVFKGYWGMPEKTREDFTDDGFFKTGDLGVWGEKGSPAFGYLSVVGRSKDLIISGGYNVYPKEVESFIDQMPGVFESAVIGLPHPDFGEAVTAVVVARAGAGHSEAALITALKAMIASFKVPKRIIFVDQLPRNAMGKVQKNVLREQFRAAPQSALGNPAVS